MKYMLLIYGAQDVQPQTPEAGQKVMDEYWAYEKAVADAGVRVASDALQGVETATTVEVRDDGERVVTDGPFAETREILGRLLPPRRPGPRRGARLGGPVPGRAARQPDRGAADHGVRAAVSAGAAGSVEAAIEKVAIREERGRLLAVARAPVRRSRPGRGGRLGRRRGGAGAVAGRRRPGPARRVVAHHGAAQGGGPAAPRQGLRGAAGGAAGRGRPGRARRRGRGRGRGRARRAAARCSSPAATRRCRSTRRWR